MEFSRGKKILLGIGVIVVLISVWYLFFSYEGCDEVGCFNDNLEKCDKATFINQGNMTFEYKILGASTDSCEVNVKFLTGRLSESDLRQLENREMNCFIPKGVVSAPESELDNCHGLLREGLQELVISRLHRYIVQNIGKINADLFGFDG
jgi:hypothetical protein